jgi:type I restriction enzyme, R subunit
VLDALVDKYRDEGALNLDDPRVLQIPPFDRMGTPLQLIKAFGDRTGFERAVHELQPALYQDAS